MCDCREGITLGSKECFDQQILIDIPPHMIKMRLARLKAGLSSKLSIDPCILQEITDLWDLGVITYGCCCGHNMLPSFVNVDDKDIPYMLQMGYEPNHPDKTRMDTFKLTSV